MANVLKQNRVLLNTQDAVSIDISPPSRFAKPPEPAPNHAAHEPVPPVEDGVSPEQAAEDILERARQEGARVLHQAETDARIIIQSAKEEAAREREAHYEEGRSEGYDDGYSAGVREAEELKAKAKQVYEEAAAERRESLSAVENDLAELIGKVVGKLVGTVAAFHPELIVALIRQGLAEATLTGEITLHVSAEDYDQVIAQKDQLLAIMETSAKLEIVKDLSLDAMDCIIETAFGNIDCSLDQQLAALKENLQALTGSDRP